MLMGYWQVVSSACKVKDGSLNQVPATGSADWKARIETNAANLHFGMVELLVLLPNLFGGRLLSLAKS